MPEKAKQSSPSQDIHGDHQWSESEGQQKFITLSDWSRAGGDLLFQPLQYMQSTMSTVGGGLYWQGIDAWGFIIHIHSDLTHIICLTHLSAYEYLETAHVLLTLSNQFGGRHNLLSGRWRHQTKNLLLQPQCMDLKGECRIVKFQHRWCYSQNLYNNIEHL